MVTVSNNNNVVILARTRMNNGHVCVGGFDIDHNRYIRLLTATCENQQENSPYQVGQVYSIEYRNRARLVQPHCEDVCVQNSYLNATLTKLQLQTILNSIAIPNIHIRDLFNRFLHWESENGSILKGFLLEDDNVLPNCSVVVVRLNHDLFLSRFNERQFYYKDGDETFGVPYVGVDVLDNLKKIAAGTLLRFSLARWWDDNGRYPVRRAYLQLSAIYKFQTA